MTNYCPECIVNWWPYQTHKGCCPACGGGTVRRQEPASLDVDDRCRALVAEQRRQHAREQFEAFYAQREAARAGEVVSEAEAILRRVA